VGLDGTGLSDLVALDLFCGAGGATKGLQRAGFRVVGVDIKPQPRYCGDVFSQADAMEFDVSGFDFVWASPPCQGYSIASACRPGVADKYPRLIDLVRGKLNGVPYVIENVAGARSFLQSPVMLCGAMFNMDTYRHRLFECNLPIPQPDHPKHTIKASRAGHWKPGTYVSVAGNASPIELSKKVMGIDWMSRHELAESIPPYFSEFIGRHIVQMIA
jgi:DNA (cytosine-5)-methyltransferase 1